MEGDDTSCGALRVVVLSRDPGFAKATRCVAAGTAARCIGVGSPYEAAAEVLNGQVLALVLDLRCLTPRHLGLLEVARQVRVEVLAIGSLALGESTADLSGVRLVSAVDLADQVRRLVRGYQGAEVGKETVRAKSARDKPREPATQEPIRTAPAAAPSQRSGHRPADLLTDEELAALLEDRS